MINRDTQSNVQSQQMELFTIIIDTIINYFRKAKIVYNVYNISVNFS